MNGNRLMLGDCLEKMDKIDDQSIDAVICDPPYGVTHCKWDSVIPLEPMWEQLKRVIKPSGAIVLFGTQPFTTTLISSNKKMFKYTWSWRRSGVGGQANSWWRPMTSVEDVIVFIDAPYKSTYNPQGLVEFNKQCSRPLDRSDALHNMSKDGKLNGKKYIQKFTNYPHQLLQFNSAKKNLIPTQKPVDLMEYLVKTYTNEEEEVLDFAMGSGTTGVACANTDRDFTGIELNEEHFDIAVKRLRG